MGGRNSTAYWATNGTIALSAGWSPTSVVIGMEASSGVIAEEHVSADKVIVK